jgi:hypothetical protein
MNKAKLTCNLVTDEEHLQAKKGEYLSCHVSIEAETEKRCWMLLHGFLVGGQHRAISHEGAEITKRVDGPENEEV